MSKAKHTPGPWQIHGSHIYGPDPQRELVAQAHGTGEGAWSAMAGSRMCANRNLIAAAPELLEALMKLSDRVIEYFPKGKIDPFLDCNIEVRQFARDAQTLIAKLEGPGAEVNK
jgi:hypothetical protein